MTEALRFIVIADSHIRPPDQEIDEYPSNALMAQRNEFIVDLANRIDAAFVIHLGDIVHPLPVEDTHVEAIRLAQGVYGGLRHPIHFVAGNHDVGDKPNAFVSVPPVAEENYSVFEEAWGSSYHSFDVGNCHFMVIDTQLLNSGLAREQDQAQWIETDLKQAMASGKRVFMFTHYPPFVRDSEENEHYDNIGEPARSWLLNLSTRHNVEALFSGHVHNFLYNKFEGTDLYVAPSTAFVRPDYSELASVPPAGENGRDDPPKLGLLVVDVTPEGHQIRPIRSFGSVSTGSGLPVPLDVAIGPEWESPVGVSLRHDWAEVTGFPTAGLDEFTRKRIRNDAPLLALWEARIRDVRIPLVDLFVQSKIDRIGHLTDRGMRFSVVSAGVPNPRSIAAVRASQFLLDRWDIAARPDQFSDILSAVETEQIESVSLGIAPIVPIGPLRSEVHHFVTSGFALGDDSHLSLWLEADPNGVFGSLLFRVPWYEGVGDALVRAAQVAEESGRTATVVVDLPRDGESTTFNDDSEVASRVAEVVRAAVHAPDVDVYLDGFIDHDRGYYPRHGLIDRAYNPRPALYRLIEESAAVSRQ